MAPSDQRGYDGDYNGGQDQKARVVEQPEAYEGNVGVTKGDGEASYAKNSESQAVAVQNLVSSIEDALDSIQLPPAGYGPVVIADLGCATGSNTLKNVDVIVNKLQRKYELQSSSLQKPEVAVFFNDLPSNDFNSLFLLLAEDSLKGSGASSDSSGKYFAAGVPGSFYCRLFPRSFVHIFFSSYSLHWLSKVPDAVLDKSSLSYNKSSCWILDAPAEVVAAFKEQAAKDLKDFLCCRAEELRSGGLLFLLFLGRENHHAVTDEEQYGEYWRLLDFTFQSLVSEGILTEEQKITFNVPSITRSLEEVSEVLDTFSAEFIVKKMELQPVFHFVDYLGTHDKCDDPKELAKKVLLMLRVVEEPLTEAHLGPALSNVFWERCTEILLSSDLVDKLYAQANNPRPEHQILLVLERR